MVKGNPVIEDIGMDQPQTTINVLRNILQIDRNARRFYEQALENLTDEVIKIDFENYLFDHVEHIQELTNMLKNFGEILDEDYSDLKGILLESYTVLRGVTGTEGTLKAMETNEKITVKAYEDALNNEILPEPRQLLEKNLVDEKRHLDNIQRMLIDFKK
jgi:uncharacterized protein (TIGR02284 family)